MYLGAGALARDEVLAAAIRLANAAAALAVQGRGVIAGMPTHDAVHALLSAR